MYTQSLIGGNFKNRSVPAAIKRKRKKEKRKVGPFADLWEGNSKSIYILHCVCSVKKLLSKLYILVTRETLAED